MIVEMVSTIFRLFRLALEINDPSNEFRQASGLSKNLHELRTRFLLQLYYIATK